jgi:hypothetical protein
MQSSPAVGAVCAAGAGAAADGDVLLATEGLEADDTGSMAMQSVSMPWCVRCRFWHGGSG